MYFATVVGDLKISSFFSLFLRDSSLNCCNFFEPNGTPRPYYSLCHELLIFCVIFSLCMCFNSLYLLVAYGKVTYFTGLISFSDLRKQLLSEISQESSRKFP